MLYLDPQSRKAFTADAAAFYRGGGISRASGYAAAVKFEHVEADVAVDHVNQPALIEHHIVALRRGPAAYRLWNEIADFARRRWDRPRRRCASRR